MIIVKSPFRISFFGGSTDYESFYKEHGSFIIGTTIDKYVYLSMRLRPSILSNESVITYSKLQLVKTWDEIQNPLIRETLKHRNVEYPIEFNSFSDIPSRTGLGGSSSFCVGMLKLLNDVLNKKQDAKSLAKEAIQIERHILNEPGGIQDQIWPAYGGLNTIEIQTNGNFLVKPLPVTQDFLKELQDSMVMIYTDSQREQDTIAKSHDNKDKLSILKLAKEANGYFIREDIKGIGELLFQTWKEKTKISNLISTQKIDSIVTEVMNLGAYGVKLLGAGGCGFVLVLCDPITKKKISERFERSIFNFEFEKNGVSQIYPGK